METLAQMVDIQTRAWTGFASTATATESPPNSDKLSVEEARVVDIVLYEHEYGRLDLSEAGSSSSSSKAQVPVVRAHIVHSKEFEQ